MAHLIDKDALVAEIERLAEVGRINANVFDERRKEKAIWLQQADVCDRILSFANTLEVKEVDLEKEFNDFLDNVEDVPRMWHTDEQIEWAKELARHFFELGLKVNNEKEK